MRACQVCGRAAGELGALRVVDSRPGSDFSRMRRRTCECGARVTTYEVVAPTHFDAIRLLTHEHCERIATVLRSIADVFDTRPVSADTEDAPEPGSERGESKA